MPVIRIKLDSSNPTINKDTCLVIGDHGKVTNVSNTVPVETLSRSSMWRGGSKSIPSKSGYVVLTNTYQSYDEEEVKRWNWAIKSQLASLINKQLIILQKDNVTQTSSYVTSILSNDDIFNQENTWTKTQTFTPTTGVGIHINANTPNFHGMTILSDYNGFSDSRAITATCTGRGVSNVGLSTIRAVATGQDGFALEGVATGISGVAVIGTAPNGLAIYGETITGIGIIGYAYGNGRALDGESAAGIGITATGGADAAGLVATSGTLDGAYGAHCVSRATNGNGVLGTSTGTGTGGKFTTTIGTGAKGEATTGIGIHGTASGTNGVSVKAQTLGTAKAALEADASVSGIPISITGMATNRGFLNVAETSGTFTTQGDVWFESSGNDTYFCYRNASGIKKVLMT